MNQNINKVMSIQVNLNGLSFCIYNKSLNTIEYLNSIDFESKVHPFDALNRLKQELSTNTVFSDNFESVNLIHQNELSAIVPKSLYDEDNKADYLKFNSKILQTDFIATDELKNLNAVSVYVPYININNYIFDTFGVFNFLHSSTLLVDSTLKELDNENTKVFINVNANTLEFVATQNKELLLYNCFEYFSKEDFIYYVLFVFEQLKLDVEVVPIMLSGTIDINSELFKILYTYIRHVGITEFKLPYKLSNSIDKDVLHNYYVILNSIACE